MKKWYFFALVLLSITASTYGQLRIAALGGPHSASVIEQNKLPDWETTVKPGYASKSGLHLGLLIEAPLSSSERWFFQPGILYQSKGRKFYMRNDTTSAILTDTISSSNNLSVNYIEMPLNIAYRIPLSKKANLLLTAGPYVGLFYNGKQKWETRIYSSNNFKDEEANLESGSSPGKIRTVDLGFNARAGLEIGNVMLTGFLSKGLTSFYTASYDGRFKNQVVGASLGFWLNKTKSPVRSPIDTDKDGVPDLTDGCPALPGAVGLKGCPDKDGDGISDPTDICPDIAGRLATGGCPPPDTDNDGLDNETDNCPDIPGGSKYNGCPIPDSDGDGLNDETDACPQMAGVVEFNGCPVPDSDGDGINDKDDKCPSESGIRANNGCPEIRKDLIDKVNIAAKNIFFSNNSDVILKNSYASLNGIAEALKANLSFMVTIEGHSDATGSLAFNKELSRKRAEAVQRYLQEKGIEAFRLSAVGYGSEKPVDTNLSPAGRARNRRVELRLIQ